MSYAHDMGHDCLPDFDDPFWDNEDDVLEVFGKVCKHCGATKLHWEDSNGLNGIWADAPQWRLYDINGKLHVCRPTKQSVKSTEQINQPLEDNWWEHLEERH